MTRHKDAPDNPGGAREDSLSGLPLLVAAMESAAHAIVITDRLGSIQWVNAAFCALTGYPADELAGRNVRLLKSGRHAPEFYDEMWQTILRGLPWRGRLVNRRRDGSEYSSHTTISPVRARDGRVTHFIAVQNPQPEALEPPAAGPHDEIAAAGRLAAGIAPDLDGLIGSINRDSASLMFGPALPPEAGEFSGRIHRAGAQAAVLAGWLAAFSRRQARKFRRIDLNESILELRRHLRAILPDSIDLRVALDPTLAAILGDEGALQEALIHLAVNSRDAMPEGGALTVETAMVKQTGPGDPGGAPRSYVLLRVTDTGTGMDAAAQSRMFEPFYTTKPEGSGAGLGLSAVYGIVKQAGGWISVYTEKGAGSSVEIFLPAL